MKQRIITAAILIAAVIPPLALGGILLDILITLAAGAMTYEFFKVINEQRIWPAAVLCAAYVYLNIFGGDAWFFISAALVMMLLFALNVFDPAYDIMKIAYLFFGATFTILALNAFLRLYAMDINIIIYLLLITYLTDSFAYFGGMLLGRHKLNERISPKKTVEGAWSGYVGGAVCGLLFGLNFITDLPTALIIAGSFVIPLFSQVGDLAMSSIKRYFGCKDFSNIFPGHGGVLDRIDSLTFSLLVFDILVRVVNL